MIYEESLLYHYKDFKDEYLNKIQNNISVISHIINNDNSKAVSTNIYRLILKPKNQIQTTMWRTKKARRCNLWMLCTLASLLLTLLANLVRRLLCRARRAKRPPSFCRKYELRVQLHAQTMVAVINLPLPLHYHTKL